jgi:hypothetical protein
MSFYSNQQISAAIAAHPEYTSAQISQMSFGYITDINQANLIIAGYPALGLTATPFYSGYLGSNGVWFGGIALPDGGPPSYYVIQTPSHNDPLGSLMAGVTTAALYAGAAAVTYGAFSGAAPALTTAENATLGATGSTATAGTGYVSGSFSGAVAADGSTVAALSGATVNGVSAITASDLASLAAMNGSALGDVNAVSGATMLPSIPATGGLPSTLYGTIANSAAGKTLIGAAASKLIGSLTTPKAPSQTVPTNGKTAGNGVSTSMLLLFGVLGAALLFN